MVVQISTCPIRSHGQYDEKKISLALGMTLRRDQTKFGLSQSRVKHRQAFLASLILGGMGMFAYNILPYLSILVLIEDKLVKNHHLILIAQNLKKWPC